MHTMFERQSKSNWLRTRSVVLFISCDRYRRKRWERRRFISRRLELYLSPSLPLSLFTCRSHEVLSLLGQRTFCCAGTIKCKIRVIIVKVPDRLLIIVYTAQHKMPRSIVSVSITMTEVNCYGPTQEKHIFRRTTWTSLWLSYSYAQLCVDCTINSFTFSCLIKSPFVQYLNRVLFVCKICTHIYLGTYNSVSHYCFSITCSQNYEMIVCCFIFKANPFWRRNFSALSA